MYSAKALVFLVGICAATAAEFSGESALKLTARAVAFGERPSGSPAIEKTQAWILRELRKAKCRISEDAFVAATPVGPKKMRNIIATFPGTSGRQIVISGHYDTKPQAGFVGANDGGSSTGLLLEMVRVLRGQKRTDTVVLVFFDGEEAVREWSDIDSLYGSRHLADKWKADGTLSKVRALINVDMIGDKGLDILREAGSNFSLVRLIWQSARDLGHGSKFLPTGMPIDDDHQPFLKFGVAAADLIDFNYGPANEYWHTVHDTIDKLGAGSFQAVGDTLLLAIKRIEAGGMEQ